MRLSLQITSFIAILVIASSSPVLAGDIDTSRDSTRAELIRLLKEANDLAQARYPDSALTLCEPLVERTRNEFGENDSTYARAITVLGTCYYYKADYGRCEVLFEEALGIRENVFQPGDFRIVNLIFNLGEIYRRRVKLEKSELYLNRALNLWKEYFGETHKKVGATHGSLGALYMMRGDFATAELYYKKWSEISKKAVGEDHPNHASALRNLAILYCRHGDWEKAERYFAEALRIFENAYGLIHPAVAWSLMGLGDIQVEQGQFEEAEPYYNRALDIRREFFRGDHPYVANSYSKMAVLNAYQGQYAPAESLFNRAIEIYLQVNGPDDTGVCEPMRQLGIMLANHGRYDEGIALIERSLEIRESAQGPNHFRIPSCYYNLALANCYTGDYDIGLEYFDKLLKSRQSLLDILFSSASENLKLKYAREYSILSPSLFSLALLDESDKSKSRSLEMILKSKAFVLDAVAAEKKIAFCSYDDNILKMTDRLSSVHTEIANLTISGGGDLESEIYNIRLKSLYDIKDSIETELSGRCSEFSENLSRKRFTADDVANSLPENAVLWEFVKYRPFDFGPTGSFKERTGEPRYLAFSLDHSGKIEITDLADAYLIDSLISESLENISDAPQEIYSGHEKLAETRLADITADLYDLIFAPLVENLNEDARIFISPDGQLSLLPFEILPCPDGEYVMEKYHLSYLSSGRDLLKFDDNDRLLERNALVVADPDFDMTLIADNNPKTFQLSAVGDINSYFPVRGDCMAEYFNPLPATLVEGETITRLLSEKAGLEVEFYHGINASEALLKSMNDPPKILHLATHGYICSENKDGIRSTNPLLNSGLVLAGANRIFDEGSGGNIIGEDGILTSLEVSALDLVGTDLVVLSACQTGTGETVSGEGVFGLRRAFQHAGARSIVMSMWSVPDKQTRELMQGFYENWLSGDSKSGALRKSALKILSDRRESIDSAHPLFWGGFVLAGDPE